MSKIIIDINPDDEYLFAVKKDTNHPVAYGGPFVSKGQCMDAVALFREYGKNSVQWHFLTDKDGFYYAEWRMNNIVIATKKLKLHRDLFALVDYLKLEISFRTPILHTIIHNTNYAARKV